MRRREDRPDLCPFLKRIPRADVVAEAALDEHRQPENGFFGLVHRDAQFGDELTIRPATTGRPVVSRDTHPRAQELAPKLARLPAVRYVAAECQDLKCVAKRSLSEFVRNSGHAAVE